MTKTTPTTETLATLPSGRPGDPAIVYRERAIGYAELEAKVVRVAAGLARLGLGRGDRLAVWLPNVPVWLVLYLAAARLGVLVVAVNTRYRAREIADILGRSGAKALALWPGFKGIDFAGVLADVPADARSALGTVIVYDEGEFVPESIAGCRTVRYDGLERGSARHDAMAIDATTPSVLFTTSGTTRAPKFVLHTHGSVTAHARDVAPGFGYTGPDTVMLQALPLCGVFGFCQAMATLAGGRPMIMAPVFDGAEAARLIARHRVTHLNGTDEMFFRIMEAADRENISLASLRLCGYAAFANAQGSALVAEGDRRGIPYVGLYGMSEVQALFARQPEAALPAQRARAGGKPISPRAACRVRDPESGKLLAPAALPNIGATRRRPRRRSPRTDSCAPGISATSRATAASSISRAWEIRSASAAFSSTRPRSRPSSSSSLGSPAARSSASRVRAEPKRSASSRSMRVLPSTNKPFAIAVLDRWRNSRCRCAFSRSTRFRLPPAPTA
jgi:fatty-acyl-CoA synthase